MLFVVLLAARCPPGQSAPSWPLPSLPGVKLHICSALFHGCSAPTLLVALPVFRCPCYLTSLWFVGLLLGVLRFSLRSVPSATPCLSGHLKPFWFRGALAFLRLSRRTPGGLSDSESSWSVSFLVSIIYRGSAGLSAQTTRPLPIISKRDTTRVLFTVCYG